MSALVVNAMRRVDPSGTLAVANRLVKRWDRVWQEIQSLVVDAVVKQDFFGIAHKAELRAHKTDLVPLPEGRYDYATSEEQLNVFMSWLRKQEENGLLEVQIGQAQGASVWSNVYVQSAYTKSLREAYETGVKGAVTQLSQAGFSGLGTPAATTAIHSVFQRPIHAERIAQAYGRTYEELKTVLQVSDTAVRREVADWLRNGITMGVTEGRGSEQIARMMAKDINGRVEAIGMNRLRMIARTETARAAHMGSMAEYREAQDALGTEFDMEVEAEWDTAEDPCDECEELKAGGPYSIDEIEGMLPAHPG